MPYVLRGTIWRAKGESGKALADDEAAIRLVPSNVLTYLIGQLRILNGPLLPVAMALSRALLARAVDE